MILTNDNVFILNTEFTTYIFHVDKTGLLFHDYYGRRIEIKDFNIEALKGKYPVSKGTTTIYKESVDPNISMDHCTLEFSFPHKGDYRATPVLFKNEKHGFVFDFNYQKYEIVEHPVKTGDIPAPKDMDEELRIYLVDEEAKVQIVLSYLVSYDTNVIARNIEIKNLGEAPLEILKALSYSLDIVNKDYIATHFTGSWASEMHQEDAKLKIGRLVHESLTGFSSNRSNPLFLLKNKNTTYESGEIYIFNLIYSGNHINEIELSTDNFVRIEAGISHFSFNYLLNKDEEFITPYAIFTYCPKGINLARRDMHNFVNNHIVNSNFKECLRPVVINNWEGTYFRFDEIKIYKIAKGGRNLGAELFVLDDGWFSNRNDDFHGLGDYDVNKKKLSHGIKGLAKVINRLKLRFGLWFEPESVNQESKLFKKHPDWAITNEGHVPSLGRHQLLLDLSKVEVQDYIIQEISKILSTAHVEYVKWDMNRNMSDIPSVSHNGTFYHSYILGLYRVMKELTEKFPHVLFEGCASGGNRFDLGILSYFPQIWCSDNTDVYERVRIQANLSYGYPLSTMSNHVSASPNHQTLRSSPLSSRFMVAMFGVLGYELLTDEMSGNEKKEAKLFMAVYKKYREIFQFGYFYEVDNYNDEIVWQVSSKDKKTHIIMQFNALQSITPKEGVLKAYHLLDTDYHIYTVMSEHDIREFGGLINQITPIHLNPNGRLVRILSRHIRIPSEKDDFVINGKALSEGGLRLSPEWSASGLNEHVRVKRDFGARIYIIEAKDEN